MTNTATSVNLENYKECLKEIVSHLSGKIFNVLTVSDGKNLKFCNRQLGGPIFSRNGQVSISLKPGDSIAWDLNIETVDLEYGISGTDITLTRTFKTGRKKTMLITYSPI